MSNIGRKAERREMGREQTVRFESEVPKNRHLAAFLPNHTRPANLRLARRRKVVGECGILTTGNPI
jgi:hypothetical protein